jgi:hypothetical protein
MTRMSLEEIFASRALRLKREEYWRLKLEDARNRYRMAAAHYRRMLDGQIDELSQRGSYLDTIRVASMAESRALAEYTRVLQLFADLVVHGKVPQDPPDFHCE